jgi:NADPH2:quinone reductase
VGGDRFVDSLRALDIGGRLMVVGFAVGAIPEVRVNRLLLRDLTVMGVALDPWVSRHPGFAWELAYALEAAARGRVRPVVGDVLPFKDAAMALPIVDGRAARGKVVVTIRP